MKITNYRLLWAVVAIAAAIPTLYFFWKLTDLDFIDSAMGNWFATMIGVLVGILIALEIDRWQQEVQSKREKETQEAEELRRKIKILQLVKKELEYNYKSLKARREDNEPEPKRVVLAQKLKEELWNAFSDGGELEWIQDLQLLDDIADAYYHIRNVIYLEDKFFEAAHFAGMRIQQKKSPEENILDYLKQIDAQVMIAIENALKAIDRHLADVHHGMGVE
ncbi:MAG TPA: hypothetical protein PLD25_32400 [Chloroflexota bacterium]|nr:hypothetical protein [Chloroflexota bacterium]